MWWTRPAVRLLAAMALPLAVPGILTLILWALPGDPAEIICPREICDGTDALAERWGLADGPIAFYRGWLANVLEGDFGRSWRIQQGVPVTDLLVGSVPWTAGLVFLATLPLVVGSVLAVIGGLSRRLDPVWQLSGLVPAVILALCAAAWVQLTYGAASHSGLPALWRLLLGAGVLALADGAMASAVQGTRSVFEAEVAQRYVAVAELRGESAWSNALPNVLPALAGQARGRVLHVLSGTVVVEVVLGIPGLGELLFDGTLKQDFGVVLAAAWAYSLLSALLLVGQAAVEVGVAGWIRRNPVRVGRTDRESG